MVSLLLGSRATIAPVFFPEVPDQVLRHPADAVILQLRTNNLVAPLAGLSDARLAGALSIIKPDVAAVIACYSFEILLRRLAVKFGVAEAERHLRKRAVLSGVSRRRKLRARESASL